MQKTWRVAVIGLDHWYSAYGLARSLPEYPAARLSGVAAGDPVKLNAFGSTFHVPAYEDFRELLAREPVDIVHIAARPAQIPEIAVACARAGKHLVLGKPIAMTLAEADRIVEAVEASGVSCLPFQAIMRLRLADTVERIRRGDIGRLLLMHQAARWSIAEDWFNSGDPGWFADPASVPGGAFIDEGIYWIDFFCHLSGSRIERVHATMRNLVHTDIAVEDWGMATFYFADGTIGTLEGGWTISAPRRSGPSPKQNAVVRFEAIGTAGEIVDQLFRAPGRAMLAAGAPDWVFERHPEALPFSPAAPFPLAHLVDCLEAGTAPVASVRDARHAFAAALAAYESARRGCTVEL